jgi:hypothetical protein
MFEIENFDRVGNIYYLWIVLPIPMRRAGITPGRESEAVPGRWLQLPQNWIPRELRILSRPSFASSIGHLVRSPSTPMTCSRSSAACNRLFVSLTPTSPLTEPTQISRRRQGESRLIKLYWITKPSMSLILWLSNCTHDSQPLPVRRAHPVSSWRTLFWTTTSTSLLAAPCKGAFR